MAFWVVSNCKTINKREEYVTELQKFIEVDIYGGCGSLTIPCQENGTSPGCWKKYFSGR